MAVQARNPREKHFFDQLRDLIKAELVKQGVTIDFDFDTCELDVKVDTFYVKMPDRTVREVKCTTDMYIVIDRIPSMRGIW